MEGAMSRDVVRFILTVAGCVTLAAALAAQSTSTSKSETKSFEVIAVDGNELIVKLPEGTRQIAVPEGFKFTVNGQQLTVAELKPGMSGTAVVTTTSRVTPVTVTEVKNATVRTVNGPTIIVQTDEGFKMFTQTDVDKRGVKIFRGGEPAQLSDFRAGDKLTATIVTSHPPKVVTEKQVEATLARDASGGAAPAAATGSSASHQAGTSETPTATTGRKLPKTASERSLVGLGAILFVGAGLGLTAARRRFEH
jgi:hypothetical protein